MSAHTLSLKVELGTSMSSAAAKIVALNPEQLRPDMLTCVFTTGVRVGEGVGTGVGTAVVGDGVGSNVWVGAGVGNKHVGSGKTARLSIAMSLVKLSPV